MKESKFNRTFFWWGIYYGIAAVLIFLIEWNFSGTLIKCGTGKMRDGINAKRYKCGEGVLYDQKKIETTKKGIFT